MRAQHAKVIELQKSVRDYRTSLSRYNNREMITKALDAGEIPLSEYYIELSLYYESMDKLLDMERAMYAAWFELLKYKY
jgi:outer membrane protein, heavy metal efflux system